MSKAIRGNLTLRHCSISALFLAVQLTLSTLSARTATSAPTANEMSLEQCLDTAMQNNHRRPASRFAVAAAEAQHRQALSGYWPQVMLKGAYQQMDEAPEFVFPDTVVGIPPQTITTPASTAILTLPAGVLGPTAVQLPVAVPSQTATTPAQLLTVPSQNIKLMDSNSLAARADVKWLLYDGGLRNGLRQQTENLVAAMKEEARRTDLEITNSVRRIYHGAVLARQLHQVGEDTLARMEATLKLTEMMYKEGSGKVTKIDFLDNKVMVSSLRSMVALLEKNEAMSRAALANTIGLPWHASVTPSETEIPFTPVVGDLADFVGTAYRLNPDWNRLEAGIRASEGAVQSARSGHYPKVALTGNLHKLWSSFDAGMATKNNKTGWTFSIGFEVPLFDGALTRSKVAEMRARLSQLRAQGILLKDGIGLQIKDYFLSLAAVHKSFQATSDAMKAAEENRDLTTRAYQNELVETEKVIRAQLVEALMTAQHLKTRYDYVALQSQLSLAVGSEVIRQLQSNP